MIYLYGMVWYGTSSFPPLMVSRVLFVQSLRLLCFFFFFWVHLLLQFFGIFPLCVCVI